MRVQTVIITRKRHIGSRVFMVSMKKRKITKVVWKYNKVYEYIRVSLAVAVVLVQIALPITPAFADEIASEPQAATTQEVVTETETKPEPEPEQSSTIEPDTGSDESEVTPPLQESDVDEMDTGTKSLDLENSGVDEQILSTDEETDTLPVANASTTTLPDSTETVLDDSTIDIVSSSTTPEVSLDELPQISESVDISTDTPLVNQSSASATATATPPTTPTVDDSVLEEIILSEIVSTTTTDTNIPTVLAPTEIENAEVVSPTQADATTTSTTSQEIVLPESSAPVNDENRYTFGVDECARVADGSFYCSEEDVDNVITEDRIFAGPDTDGDSEIYIEKDGVLSQLTHNIADDTAPFYDEQSESIVWHRLVDARYQIMSLDLAEGVETQLTHDSYNNMQPTRYGDLIVWQGWVGNDWEVIMYSEGEIQMLTDNTTHDVGPRINGEYIIWQAEESDGWRVRVYNTNTKSIETIADTEGASVENPRLVLVYDAKHQNGDVETRGYDLDTGKSVSLSQEAPVLPDELPDPDQTGEERALITATSQLKPKTDDEEGEPEPIPTVPPTDTSTSTLDLVVAPFTDLASSTASESVPQIDSTLIDDLIVSSTTQEYDAPLISDLVIPKYSESLQIQSDPQIEVASST